MSNFGLPCSVDDDERYDLLAGRQLRVDPPANGVERLADPRSPAAAATDWSSSPCSAPRILTMRASSTTSAAQPSAVDRRRAVAMSKQAAWRRSPIQSACTSDELASDGYCWSIAAMVGVFAMRDAAVQPFAALRWQDDESLRVNHGRRSGFTARDAELDAVAQRGARVEGSRRERCARPRAPLRGSDSSRQPRRDVHRDADVLVPR